MSEASVLFDAPGPRALRRYRITAVATVVGIIAIMALITWKLWVEDQLTVEKWEPFVTPEIIEFLLEALLETLKAAVLAIAGAMVFGVVLGVGKLSDHTLMRWPSWVIVEFFRAVPLLLLIIFIWALQGYPRETIFPLVLGLILYNGSVLAEIFRAGINAVPKGQSEASYAIGMRKNQVMRIVLLPQAVKIMLPAIISQCVVALKDTALGFIVAAPQLATVIKDIYSGYQNPIAAGLVAAVIYIVINYTLSRIAQWLEARNRRKGRQVVKLTNIPAAAGGMGSGAPAP
jgi:glutamate transport system permease protein